MGNDFYKLYTCSDKVMFKERSYNVINIERKISYNNILKT